MRWVCSVWLQRTVSCCQAAFDSSWWNQRKRVTFILIRRGHQIRRSESNRAADYHRRLSHSVFLERSTAVPPSFSQGMFHAMVPLSLVWFNWDNSVRLFATLQRVCKQWDHVDCFPSSRNHRFITFSNSQCNSFPSPDQVFKGWISFTAHMLHSVLESLIGSIDYSTVILFSESL